jgi:hypothetical protein
MANNRHINTERAFCDLSIRIYVPLSNKIRKFGERKRLFESVKIARAANESDYRIFMG